MRVRTTALRITTAAAVAAGVLALSAPAPVAALGECGVSDPLQNVYEGPANGSWTNTAYWSMNELPADGNICVPAGRTVLVPGGTFLVNHAVGQFATLRVAGTVRIADDSAAVVFASIYGGTDLEITGRIEVSDGATFDLNPDQNGAPAFQLKAGGVIAVSTGANVNLTRPLVNNGTIALASGGNFNVDSGGAYSGSGKVTGGRMRQRGGSVRFGTGSIKVTSRGGTVSGTISAASALDIRCDTFSNYVDVSGLTNKGTIKMLPPIAGECSMGLSLRGGTVFRNAGTLAIGTPSKSLGFGYYGINSFNNGGTIVNTGTMKIDDYWTGNVNGFTNIGVVEVGPKGRFVRSGYLTTNKGKLIARGSLDFSNLTTSGLVELYQPTLLQGTFTMTRTATLKVHASKNTLSGFTSVFAGSKIDGTLTIVTAKKSKPPKGWQKTVMVPVSSVSGRFDRVNGKIPGTNNKYSVIYVNAPSGGIDLRVVAR